MPGSINEFLNPYLVPEGQRYWVVRAESGEYFPNFREGGCIAIGHIDELSISNTKEFSPDFEALSANLRRVCFSDGESKSSFTSTINQVEKFIFTMSIGDLVVTPDLSNERIMIGKIVGNPYYDSSPITVFNPKIGGDTRMTLGLRRSVKWSGVISRRSFPANLMRALRANQTVFCVDEHWEAVLHMLFPTFHKGGKTYISIIIGQEDEIKNKHLAKLLYFLSEAEVFCAQNGVGEDKEDLSLVTKTQVMSPGDVMASFMASLPESMVMLVVVSSILFGNKLLGFDGVIDKEMRHKICDFVLRRWEKTGGEEAAAGLRLNAPNVDASGIVGDSGASRKTRVPVPSSTDV